MTGVLFDKEGGGTIAQRILSHVGHYGITTPHATERLFFHTDDSADRSEQLNQAVAALDELTAEGKLTRIGKARKKKGKALQEVSNRKWTFERSVYVQPEHKIKPWYDLARLWFCCLERQRRFYVQHEEIKPLFAAEGIEPPYHNFFHAMADEEGGPVLYRLYLCQAEKKNAAQQIAKIIGQNAKQFLNWIDQGSYGVAVIVQTAQKKKEIEDKLAESYGGKESLNQRARFIVTIAPAEKDYPAAIERYEQKASQ